MEISPIKSTIALVAFGLSGAASDPREKLTRQVYWVCLGLSFLLLDGANVAFSRHLSAVFGVPTYDIEHATNSTVEAPGILYRIYPYGTYSMKAPITECTILQLLSRLICRTFRYSVPRIGKLVDRFGGSFGGGDIPPCQDPNPWRTIGDA